MNLLFKIIGLFIIIIPPSFAQKMHTPAEIFQLLNKSKLSYEVTLLKEDVSAKDQRLNLNSADFYRKTDANSMVTMKIELTKEAREIKEKAELFFKQKQYSEAREAYQKILKIHPEYSKIITYIGQTYYFQGDQKKAIEHYKKAISNNYIDYMAHWFLARIYLENNEIKNALNTYLVAHILNRNHIIITKELQAVLQKSGYRFEDWTFTPQIKLSTQDSQKIIVGCQKEWINYAFAKAIWAFEPGYRESMGVKKGEISLLEEKEALVGLYVGNLEDKKFTKLPFYVAFHNAFENKQIEEFILYELLIVEDPFIAYQFPEELIDKIKKYILESRCTPSKKKKKRKKRK